VLVVVCVSALGAARAPALSTQRAMFEAHFGVVETTAPDPVCRGLRIRHTGSGMATHFGKATWSGGECADFLATPGRVHLRDGRGVLTSASGDRLHVSYEADGNLPSLAGDVHVTGPFTITGGTGRFSGATGSGTLTADANAFRPDATIDMTGTLSLSR
jgi:hypothetical protein